MLKVNEFFSVAAHLTKAALSIIHSVSMNPAKMVEKKGHLDYVTEADYRIQGIVSEGLRSIWPKINIIGEQSKTLSLQEDRKWLKEINSNFIDASVFSAGRLESILTNQIPIQNTCVWIDPLDGTLDFVNGNFQCVTSLIGYFSYQLTLNGRPELAVIGQAFQKLGEERRFEPKITMARKSTEFVLIQEGQAILKRKVQKIPFRQKLIIGLSGNRPNPDVKSLIDKMGVLQDQVMTVGGFGYKAIKVLEGDIDFYLYMNKQTSRWDSCCAQVLMDLIGGKVADLSGEEYKYQMNGQLKNDRGIIVARNMQTWQLIQKNLQTAKL